MRHVSDEEYEVRCVGAFVVCISGVRSSGRCTPNWNITRAVRADRDARCITPKRFGGKPALDYPSSVCLVHPSLTTYTQLVILYSLHCSSSTSKACSNLPCAQFLFLFLFFLVLHFPSRLKFRRCWSTQFHRRLTYPANCEDGETRDMELGKRKERYKMYQRAQVLSPKVLRMFYLREYKRWGYSSEVIQG